MITFNASSFSGRLTEADLCAHALAKLDESSRWDSRGLAATRELQGFLREAWPVLSQAWSPVLVCTCCGSPVDLRRRDGLGGVA